MDRSEFLKLFGVGGAVAFIPASVKGTEKEEIVTKEPDKDFEALYNLFKDKGVVNIHGIDFHMTELTHNLERFGNSSVDLQLTARLFSNETL